MSRSVLGGRDINMSQCLSPRCIQSRRRGRHGINVYKTICINVDCKHTNSHNSIRKKTGKNIVRETVCVCERREQGKPKRMLRGKLE